MYCMLLHLKVQLTDDGNFWSFRSNLKKTVQTNQSLPLLDFRKSRTAVCYPEAKFKDVICKRFSTLITCCTRFYEYWLTEGIVMAGVPSKQQEKKKIPITYKNFRSWSLVQKSPNRVYFTILILFYFISILQVLVMYLFSENFISHNLLAAHAQIPSQQ